MNKRADLGPTSTGSSPAAGDLPLRLELLRSRVELDAVRRLLERTDSSAQASADGTELPETVAAALSDSRQLAQLKSSRRYRLASLLAEAANVPLRKSRDVLRLAKRSLRYFRGSEGQKRPDVQGSALNITGFDQKDLPLHPLQKADSPPDSTSELRVAAVLDPFSAASFGPECSLELLEPIGWGDQIRRFKPHLLLVESAWTGHSGQWKGLVERGPAQLRSLVGSCRKAGIPTVFWNKEDPLHFGAFLETARVFDHVLTTDADCVSRYRRLLGHDRVGVMPFAVQPTIHHPVCSKPRQGSSVFAGAWYGRLPERSRDFTRSADALALAGELFIHDRLNGTGEPHQRFPRRYKSIVRRAVNYQETGELFRSHLIGLNLNTIKSSPTMFARRAFELAACGTSVYSNFSLGLHVLLADSVVVTDEPERLLTEAWKELRDPGAKRYRTRRLQALRAVMREHTWAHRLQHLGEIALGVELSQSISSLFVLARACTQAELDRVCKKFSRQRGVVAKLILDAPPHLMMPENAVRLESWQASDADWIALFHPDDYYGPHYLSDLVAATKWGLGDFIGKGAWHELGKGVITEHNAESEYRFVESLALRRMIFRNGAVSDPAALLDDLDSGVIAAEGCVSIDSWEYLLGGAESDLGPAVSVACANTVGMQEIVRTGSRLPAQKDPEDPGADAIDGPALLDVIVKGGGADRLSVALRSGRIELCSRLNDGESAKWTTAPLPRHQLEVNGVVQVCLQAVRSTSTSFRLEAIGARGVVLESLCMEPQMPLKLTPPADVHHYRIAIDVRGPVVQEVDGVWVGSAPIQPLFVPGRGRLALVCNAYPHYRNLYRNAFLHRRVLAYQERGIGVDVFVVNRGPSVREYEYDGVIVRACPPEVLRETLAISGHAAVAVHFLDPDLWEAVRELTSQTPLVVWLHGAEVQTWRHRAFNYQAGPELNVAKEASEQRSKFWKTIMSQSDRDLHYVFVSDHLAQQTWTDLGIRPPDRRWSVIHNPIDSRLFRYEAKQPKMAKKILSIRPHASKIYANDLVAATIRRLAEEEVFSELSFTLVGDGELWDENFNGLERYPNVTLVRSFLSQAEIAELHRKHGVFLVPTRGDTQGVSRDEAMSSGLVPITTRVGAVPEFVDASCGELCPPEDVDALASSVLRLASDPEGFKEKSAGAAARVERQSGCAGVIAQELSVLGLHDQSRNICCAGNVNQEHQVPL